MITVMFHNASKTVYHSFYPYLGLQVSKFLQLYNAKICIVCHHANIQFRPSYIYRKKKAFFHDLVSCIKTARGRLGYFFYAIENF